MSAFVNGAGDTFVFGSQGMGNADQREQRNAVSGETLPFGCVFRPQDENYESPVFVSATDGIGTKLKTAFMLDKHDTIGIDCVATCVNDVVCSGAKPLFFLDYIALGKYKQEKVEEIITGVKKGCELAGCSLVGGHTAQMPGFFQLDEYDIAGFCVGIAEESKLITAKDVAPGDVLIGLASSGLHANAYSIVRRVFRLNEANIRLYLDDLGRTIGEELITPTRIYVRSILSLLNSCEVKGIANVKSGGLFGNIPRILGEGCAARIERSAIRVLPIFKVIQSMNRMSEPEMYSHFNMGVGMVVAVAPENAQKALDLLNASGETAYVIGDIVEGERSVQMV